MAMRVRSFSSRVIEGSASFGAFARAPITAFGTFAREVLVPASLPTWSLCTHARVELS